MRMRFNPIPMFFCTILAVGWAGAYELSLWPNIAAAVPELTRGLANW